MMLFLTCVVLFITLSSAERASKLPRQKKSSGSAFESHYRSSSVSNELVLSSSDVESNVVSKQTTLESPSANTDYDLLRMQEGAVSLLRSLEDIRYQLSQQQPLDQLTGEKQELLVAIDTNIAVVSLAVENVKKLLSSENSSETNSSTSGDSQLKDLNMLLDAGEKEKSKLIARLMQLKRQWISSSPTNSHIPIDIRTSITDEKDSFQVQLRRLLPESLEQQIDDYDDDQLLVVLPPSHFGSGLLSDTGHEDEVLAEEYHQSIIPNQPVRGKQAVPEQLIRESHTTRKGQTVNEDESNEQTTQPPLNESHSTETPQSAKNSTQELTETSATTRESSANSCSISAFCFSLMVLIFLC